MLDSLDLLVIVFLVLGVVSLLALALLWLVKKPIVRRICLFALAAVSLYLAAANLYIGGVFFPGQTAIGLLCGAAAIAAVVLDFTGKSPKTAVLSRSLMSAAAVVGLLAFSL